MLWLQWGARLFQKCRSSLLILIVCWPNVNFCYTSNEENLLLVFCCWILKCCYTSPAILILLNVISAKVLRCNRGWNVALWPVAASQRRLQRRHLRTSTFCSAWTLAASQPRLGRSLWPVTGDKFCYTSPAILILLNTLDAKVLRRNRGWNVGS